MLRRLSRTAKILAAVVLVIAVAVAAGLIWWFQRDEAPEAVDLETTVARIEEAGTAGDSPDEASSTESTDSRTEATSTDASVDSSAVSSTYDTAAAGTSDSAAAVDDSAADSVAVSTEEIETASADQTIDALAGLAGVWTVQVAEDAGDLQGEPTVSFAGFRVDEVLNSIGDFTAVGRTADVSGSIELSDTALVAATVEVTMSTLRTDNSFRDGRIYGALNTSEFPEAIFTLADPVELPAGMADGEAFSGSAEGDLTIKGVTNRATFDLQAQLVGDIIVAVGSSDVVFSDYDVRAPTAPIVVSVEDHGIMEFQLIFTR